MIVKRELAETRFTCVRVREVLKGSRGGETSSASGGGGGGLGRGLVMSSSNVGGVAMWLGLVGGWLVFF